MQRRSHRSTGWRAGLAVAVLAFGVAPAALGADGTASGQSTIERLVRQEDARKTELTAYEANARRIELTAMLDARERAMLAGSPSASDALDPAIRTAMLAHASAVSVATPTASAAPQTAADEFAWGAAALGLGAGVAAMCVLLGCVTLVRSHGRLHSV